MDVDTSNLFLITLFGIGIGILILLSEPWLLLFWAPSLWISMEYFSRKTFPNYWKNKQWITGKPLKNHQLDGGKE